MLALRLFDLRQVDLAKIDALFKQYKVSIASWAHCGRKVPSTRTRGLQGSDTAIDVEGMMNFAKDLEIEVTDPRMLVIAWKFNV